MTMSCFCTVSRDEMGSSPHLTTLRPHLRCSAMGAITTLLASSLWRLGRAFCCCWVIWHSLLGSSEAQSNIVLNGSFEQLDAGWTGAGLDIYQDQGAADGRFHVAVTAYLWQDLSTVQGRDYVLSFALRYGSPAVWWGGT